MSAGAAGHLRQVRKRVLADGTTLLLQALVALVALLVAMVFVLASGVSPGRGATAFIEGAFGTEPNIAGTLAKMVPLTLVALGWIVVYRGGRFHVGFPGQILVGGLFVSIAALKLSLPAPLHLPVCVLAGAVGGGAYAAIAAWLWARRGINEILSTLLLNLVAAQLLAWWVRGPFHDSTTPLALTPPFPESARWPALLQNTLLHWDIVLVPIAVVAIGFLLSRTSFGLRIRIVGANPRLAEHAGIAPHRVGSQAIVLSGALAGIAGASLVLASSTPAMSEDFGAEYGFTGIAVALLARNSPLGVLPAALLFAALSQGGGVMEGTVGLSSSIVSFIQGLMIVLVLGATLALYRGRRRQGVRSEGRADQAEPAPAPTGVA